MISLKRQILNAQQKQLLGKDNTLWARLNLKQGLIQHLVPKDLVCYTIVNHGLEEAKDWAFQGLEN